MSGKRSRALRKAAAEADRRGFGEATKELHGDDGLSRYRGIRHRVYQELKRTWSRRGHRPTGRFTDRRRPGREEAREKIRTNYARRMG